MDDNDLGDPRLFLFGRCLVTGYIVKLEHMMTLRSAVVAKSDAGGDVQSHPGRRMSEEEFVRWWRPNTRAEWVDGEVSIMPPASFDHVSLNDWFVAILLGYVQRKDLGAVVSREFSVRLPNQRRRRLPDVLFVNKERLGIIHENHAEGAPDLIVEIVSPESESRDWREKYLEYEQAGVREYWVIDPMSRHVEVYFLSEGRYVELAEQDGKFISQVIPGFFLRTEWLWQKPPPHQLEVFRELGL